MAKKLNVKEKFGDYLLDVSKYVLTACMSSICDWYEKNNSSVGFIQGQSFVHAGCCCSGARR